MPAAAALALADELLHRASQPTAPASAARCRSPAHAAATVRPRGPGPRRPPRLGVCSCWSGGCQRTPIPRHGPAATRPERRRRPRRPPLPQCRSHMLGRVPGGTMGRRCAGACAWSEREGVAGGDRWHVPGGSGACANRTGTVGAGTAGTITRRQEGTGCQEGNHGKFKGVPQRSVRGRQKGTYGHPYGVHHSGVRREHMAVCKGFPRAVSGGDVWQVQMGSPGECQEGTGGDK